VYVDGILLLSASVTSLQAMLNICDDYGCKHNILFNSKKSVCFKIGSKWSSATDCMRLINEDIKWVSSCKYLGVMSITDLDLPGYKVKDLGVCWNDTFRKIFGYN